MTDDPQIANEFEMLYDTFGNLDLSGYDSYERAEFWQERTVALRHIEQALTAARAALADTPEDHPDQYDPTKAVSTIVVPADTPKPSAPHRIMASASNVNVTASDRPEPSTCPTCGKVLTDEERRFGRCIDHPQLMPPDVARRTPTPSEEPSTS